ncbi:hypothetical protein L211DRAFT_47634 [Terfezia boudieri ATCC MYA-4762]|uniref:Uncharacterized protein n=1 Tax=Terfezia boudieri ATCC MYA-4762 TaxID=1051890 RepID=A0A3N4M8T4_9PEZI|nr:hypothetical protein L211DRAFT_47634 [Terfezia boudieri ATCC MYA-4762]
MFKPPPTISHTPKSPVTADASRDTMPASGGDTKTKATDAPAELSAVVDDLLDNLSKKFVTVSLEIYEKMDAMSKRLDAMERGETRGETKAGDRVNVSVGE